MADLTHEGSQDVCYWLMNKAMKLTKRAMRPFDACELMRANAKHSCSLIQNGIRHYFLLQPRCMMKMMHQPTNQVL